MIGANFDKTFRRRILPACIQTFFLCWIIFQLMTSATKRRPRPPGPPAFVSFTHDEPGSHSRGPIIEGWPPSRNRSMSLYIDADGDIDTLIDTSCLQLTSVEARMLIFIQSAPEMVKRREANRKTWMQFGKDFPEVRTLFVFGTTDTENKTLLMQEQERNCDLLQFDFVDHYSNVTLDTVYAMKFVLRQRWKKRPEFVMIGDDDAYLNVPELWKRLFEDLPPVISKTGNILWGCYMEFRDVHFPEDTAELTGLNYLPNDNWTYCPRYMFNQPLYPAFLSGGGYIVPFHLVECLYRKSLDLPYFHINDVLVTGFARQLCHAELDESLAFFAPTEAGSGILHHRVGEEEMYRIHKYHKL